MIVVARGAPRSCVFQLSQRSGVWSVSRDTAFYGDYLSRAEATDAACAAARTVETLGGEARVSAPSGEAIDHRFRGGRP